MGVAVNVGSGKAWGATSTGVELVVANSAGEGVGVVSLVNSDCDCIGAAGVEFVVANPAAEGDAVALLVSAGVAVSSDVEGEGDFNESDGWRRAIKPKNVREGMITQQSRSVSPPATRPCAMATMLRTNAAKNRGA